MAINTFCLQSSLNYAKPFIYKPLKGAIPMSTAAPGPNLRQADNQLLRRAVVARQDEMLELALAHPAVQAAMPMATGFDLNALIQSLIAAFGPVLAAALLQILHPQAPPVVPPSPPPIPPPVVPPVVPPPTPPPVQPPAPPPPPVGGLPARLPRRRIGGGEAHITGFQEGLGAKFDAQDNLIPNSVRQWVDLSEDRVDEICFNGANAPGVSRMMTDATPMDETGALFGPNDSSWNDDPQPGSVEDPFAQPMRMVWDGSDDRVYLTHEWQDFGCRNWARSSLPPGVGASIRNPHYVGPRYQDTGRFATLPLLRKGRPVTVINFQRH